ncbi:hypothetical protein [Lactococcus lactis]|uniref:hypothetical protein n=1 Tax=Lactococcus lactis TaxID=1358 RepID=UPI00117B3B1F|nr:hypothetical protein [Lactococcus lactis]TRW76688.1 hypothetical protein FNJ54_06305 [Lactococcus lactis]
MEEIYREEARRYKESIEKGRVYSESEDILTGNFDKSKSLTVTIPMEEFDKLEKLALSAHTDSLSVEKLQEQLNTAKKALTNIKLRTERDELETYYVERNHDIRKDAIDALAAIGGDR